MTFKYINPFHGATLKYGEVGFFPKNIFMGGQIFGGEFMGGLFYIEGLMTRSWERRVEFHIVYFLVN